MSFSSLPSSSLAWLAAAASMLARRQARLASTIAQTCVFLSHVYFFNFVLDVNHTLTASLTYGLYASSVNANHWNVREVSKLRGIKLNVSYKYASVTLFIQDTSSPVFGSADEFKLPSKSSHCHCFQHRLTLTSSSFFKKKMSKQTLCFGKVLPFSLTAKAALKAKNMPDMLGAANQPKSWIVESNLH